MELDQETIFKFQVFEQQINQINSQLEAVEQAINELISVRQGLEELEGKKEREILAPIGRGIFVKAKLLSEDLLVDVGGKKFVDKSIPDTKNIIEEQIKKIEEIREELTKSLEEINNELTSIMMKAQKQHSCSCDECGCEDECSCDDNECGCGEECGKKNTKKGKKK